MKNLVILLIKIYQKTLSTETGLLGKIYSRPPTCRFYPTCSEYTVQAVRKYGTIKGLWLGVKRVGRCHPGHPGGIDKP